MLTVILMFAIAFGLAEGFEWLIPHMSRLKSRSNGTSPSINLPATGWLLIIAGFVFFGLIVVGPALIPRSVPWMPLQKEFTYCGVLFILIGAFRLYQRRPATP